MWATNQPFAERWATRGRYRRLPERVEGKAEEAPVGRKPMTPQERARHAALVRWKKKNPLAARLAALREKRKAKGAAPAGSPVEQTDAGGLDKKPPTGTLAEQAAGSLAKKPAPEKKKGGGGGGGAGKEEKPDKAAEAAQRTAAALDAVGLKPGDLDALRAAAEGGDVDEAQIDGLAEDGLVEPDGKGGFITTDAGRRALRALERGDVRGYRAALQDVTAARGRTQEREKRRAAQEEARASREAERQARDAAREQAQRDREAQELDDLADDFRRGRRGLSFAEQRKLIRAGRARLNGERFELKVEDAVGNLDLDGHPRRPVSRRARLRERMRMKGRLSAKEFAVADALGLVPPPTKATALLLELSLLELSL